MDKISVIVPCYNAALFLSACLDSLLDQTFCNFEVIAVDDGSADETACVLKEYVQRDDRIVVVTQPNGGQSSARNAGLDRAEGDYITFVDSDDRVNPDFLQSLYEAMKKYDADIAVCSHIRRVGERDESQVRGCGTVVMDNRQGFAHILRQDIFSDYLWDKLFAASLFQGIRFPEGRIYEDTAVCYRLFARAGKSVYLDRPLYEYRIHQGSTTNGSFSPRAMELVRACEETLAFTREHYPELEKQAMGKLLRHAMGVLLDIPGAGDEFLPQYRRLAAAVGEYWRGSFGLVPPKTYAALTAVRFFPEAFRRLYARRSGLKK